ncbi:hypothetical protein IAU60_004307 [Kwoniella sp. DSM 27419]
MHQPPNPRPPRAQPDRVHPSDNANNHTDTNPLRSLREIYANHGSLPGSSQSSQSTSASSSQASARGTKRKIDVIPDGSDSEDDEITPASSIEVSPDHLGRSLPSSSYANPPDRALSPTEEASQHDTIPFQLCDLQFRGGRSELDSPVLDRLPTRAPSATSLTTVPDLLHWNEYTDVDRAGDEEEFDGDMELLLLDDMSDVEDAGESASRPTDSSVSAHRLPGLPIAPIHDRQAQLLDDDARIFADLVRRTEAKRNYETEAWSTVTSAPSPPKAATVSSSSSSDRATYKTSSDTFHPHWASKEREAQVFLESLIVGFLTDLDDSFDTMNEADQQSQAGLKRKRKRKIQRQEDATRSALTRQRDYESQQGVRVSGKRADHMGIKIELKNRMTGNSQVTSYPDDPTALNRKGSSIGKITCIIAIATVLYEAILTQTVITLRDIFYRDKALFGRQDIVDKMVDDMVATANLKRRDFYVCASAKGLIAASGLIVHRRDGQAIQVSATSATLVDPIERIDRLESGRGIDWVLVVEKDAVFQTLCSAKLLEDGRVGHGIIVTGKGFPDLATRQMLRLIADTFVGARLFALVDADPHGLSILSTYTLGSRSTAHAHEYSGLALGDRLEWMGVKASDLGRLGVSYDELLPLEKGDIQLATSMLRRHADLPRDWKRELCQIIHLNRKAEIEIVLSTPSEDACTLGSLFQDGQAAGRGESPPSSGADRKTRNNKLIEYIVERLLS